MNSVVGEICDNEFDTFTKMLFDKAFRGEIRLIISELLEEELINAPPVKLIRGAIELAEMYIAWEVVGETSRADC